MKRLRKRLCKGVVAMLGATLLLSACGGGGAGDAGAGGERAISMAVTEPKLLIPGRQDVAFDLSMAVWAPLTYLELDGTLNYIQAESVESDDQITWTITLRDGWTFHDGSDVTAQDYVDTWNTVAYGPNAFENSGQLSKIVGFDELNTADGEPAKEMSGLTVVDELTFEVELSSADSQFPVQLTQSQTGTFPMPSESLSDLDAYNAHPIGNGAFAVSED